MYKRVLALMMVGVISMASLSGCGGGSSEPAATEKQEAAPANDTAADTADDGGADAEEADDAGETSGSITFADVQENYATMTEVYNQVNDLYMNDGIAQSDEVEELLSEAKGIIEEMGELTEDQFESEDDMIALNDSMVKIIEGLGGVVDMMETTGEAAETTAADSSTWDSFDSFYAGVTDDENTYMLLAFGQNDELGCAMFIDTSTSESGSWVGAVTVDEDNHLMSITDESNGTSLGFSVEESGNGYLLDMGDVGAAVVSEVSKDDFAAAAQEIENGSVPQF